MEENLKSFHLSPVVQYQKPHNSWCSTKKNLKKVCNDSHTSCIVDEESTIEETTAFQKWKKKMLLLNIADLRTHRIRP